SDLDPLSQRSFTGSVLRELAQLAARCAVPARSRTDRDRKCLARSGNRSGAAGVVYTNRAQPWPKDHRGDTRRSRSSYAETRKPRISGCSTPARNEHKNGRLSRTNSCERLRTRPPSHHSGPIRCPRWDYRSLFVADAVAVSIGIFRRSNRITA